MNTIPDLPTAALQTSKTPKQKGLKVVAVVAIIFAALALQLQAVKRRLPFFAPRLEPTRFVQITGGASTLTFSPDNKSLLVSGGGHTNFVEASTGRVLRSWESSGYEMRWSSDGRRTLERNYDSANKRVTVILRDASSGRVLHQWTPPTISYLGEVSRDLRRILNYSYTNKALQICDTATGRVLATTPNTTGGYNIRLSRNGRWVFDAQRDRPSQILRTTDLQPAFPQIHLPPLVSVGITRDEQRIIGLEEKTAMLHFWQLPSGAYSTQDTGFDSADWFYSLPNGNLVLLLRRREQQGKNLISTDFIQVRSADGSRVLHEIPGRPYAYSPNGHIVGIRETKRDFRGMSDGTTHFFNITDLTTGKPIGRLNVETDPLGQAFGTLGSFDLQLAIATSGQSFAVASDSGLVRFFDRGNSAGLRPTGSVSTAAGSIAPEGAQILGTSASLRVSTGPFGSMTMMGGDGDEFSSQSGTMKNGGTEFNVQYQSKSPDGRQSVWFCHPKPSVQSGKTQSAGAIARPRIEVRDSTGRFLNTLQLPGGQSGSMRTGSLNKPSWSPDGTLFAVSDQFGHIFWWQVRSGRLIGQLSCARADFKKGTMSGPMIMLGFNLAARLAFSPNNRYLAAGRNDGSIYLYDLQTRLPTAQIGKSANQLYKLGFSIDGSTLYGIPINGKDVLAWDVPQMKG